MIERISRPPHIRLGRGGRKSEGNERTRARSDVGWLIPEDSLEKKSWTPFHQRGSQRGLLHTKKKKNDPLKKSNKKDPLLTPS